MRLSQVNQWGINAVEAALIRKTISAYTICNTVLDDAAWDDINVSLICFNFLMLAAEH
jgi:hypothetical protein